MDIYTIFYKQHNKWNTSLKKTSSIYLYLNHIIGKTKNSNEKKKMQKVQVEHIKSIVWIKII